MIKSHVSCNYTDEFCFAVVELEDFEESQQVDDWWRVVRIEKNFYRGKAKYIIGGNTRSGTSSVLKF